MKKIIIFIGALFISVLFAMTALAEDVTLEWDPNSESDLAGYRMYRDGVQIGEDIPAGTETYTDLKVANGIYPYYVTAFDTGGLESDHSNIVVALISDIDIIPPDPPKGVRKILRLISKWTGYDLVKRLWRHDLRIQG